MSQRKYLNLGCGRIILPCEKPLHHALVDTAIYNYPLWHNVDRNGSEGVDECVDVFTYPFPWADNSFDGALLSHLCEHIPHEIDLVARYTYKPYELWTERDRVLSEVQDGWYAFFAELYRVLTDGAIVHILSPYGWSQGAITDPTHTRLLTEHTFTHSMQPDTHSPFQYETGGINFEMVGSPQFGITEMFQHLVGKPELLQLAFQTNINVAYDMYIKLRVVK